MNDDDAIRQRTLDRLDTLIDEMSRRLPFMQRVRGWHEGNGGWTEESRMDWLKTFQELRERVARRDSVEDEAHHLLRWLDGSGIVGGSWYQAAASIQNDMWELTKLRKDSGSARRG